MVEAGFVITPLCPLPEEVRSKYPIVDIPSPVFIDEEEYPDNDVPFSLEKVCNILVNDSRRVGSSQSPPSDYIEVFESFPDDVPLFVFCLSSELSGYYSSAMAAAKKFKEKDITVINTRLAPPAMTMLAISASRIASDTSEVDELKKKVEKLVANTHQYSVFNSLKYLYKTGRINAVQALIGGIIKLTPIVTSNEKGELITVAKPRRMKRAFPKMIDFIKDKIGNKENDNLDAMIVYSYHSKEDAEAFREKLTNELDIDNIETVQASYALHRFYGPKSVSFSCCVY